ncbi:MAG: nucleotidyltransferase family protein [Anaerolineae bacterium]|nr:nucleotidyltransferase family protein [Anaerolineae bacterium]
MSAATYQLLALCARAECRPIHCRQLALAAGAATDWEDVLAQAEMHHLSPLLYTHLKAAGVAIPATVKRELRSRSMRHLVANQVRTRVLCDILSVYEAACIPVLVLKGAALSHIIYPDISLRPMSDLDLLVPASEAHRAQQVLADLGFEAPPLSSSMPHHRHLTEVTKCVEDIPVTVEVHRRLCSDYFDSAFSYIRAALLGQRVKQGRSQTALDGVTGPPYPFTVDGLTARTLGHEDALGYLCRHLVSHVNAWDFGRLIWMADIVSLAERFAAEIDWGRVQRQSPVVLRTLSLLHVMTPLSDELLKRASIEIGQAPEGIGVEFQGWPQVRRGRSVLRDTFFPSEWWLRLRYNLGSTHALFSHRWIRHPLYIVGQAVRALLERLGWPKALELTGRHTTKTAESQ